MKEVKNESECEFTGLRKDCETYGRNLTESSDRINPSNYKVVTVDGRYGIKRMEERNESVFTLTEFLGLVR